MLAKQHLASQTCRLASEAKVLAIVILAIAREYYGARQQAMRIDLNGTLWKDVENRSINDQKFSPSQENLLRIGVLAGHDGGAWAHPLQQEGCDGTSHGRALAECNLQVYNEAAGVASRAGVQMLVFPEGYGLTPMSDYFEIFEPSSNGTNLCKHEDASQKPQQVALSCAALHNRIAVVANVFVSLDGKNYITEFVFDSTGVLLTWYFKHHLMPFMETRIFTAGPFAPTSFELFGVRWGLVICYEGFYSIIFGDCSQFDAFGEQQVSAILWGAAATGGMVPAAAHLYSKTYNVGVVATEAVENVSIILRTDDQRADYTYKPLNYKRLSATGYRNKPFVRYSDVKLATHARKRRATCFLRQRVEFWSLLTVIPVLFVVCITFCCRCCTFCAPKPLAASLPCTGSAISTV